MNPIHSLPAPTPPAGRRTAATMFPLVEAWQSGTLSQKAFCHERGIPLHVFVYWLRKYREQQEGGTGFVALRVSEPTARIRLDLGAGRVLEISGPVPACWLAELIVQLT